MGCVPSCRGPKFRQKYYYQNRPNRDLVKNKTDFEGFLTKNKIRKTFQTNNIYLAYKRVLTQDICLV